MKQKVLAVADNGLNQRCVKVEVGRTLPKTASPMRERRNRITDVDEGEDSERMVVNPSAFQNPIVRR